MKNPINAKPPVQMLEQVKVILKIKG